MKIKDKSQTNIQRINGFKGTTVEKLNEAKIEVGKEEFTRTGETETIAPKSIISNSSEILDRLKGFTQDNPLWLSFTEGMVAGTELSKELVTYMGDLKSNIEKAYKKTKNMNKGINFLEKNGDEIFAVPIATSIALLGLGAIFNIQGGVPNAGYHLLADAGLFAGAIIGLNMHPNKKLVPSMNVKGERFLPAGYHNEKPAFLTIPPGTNKLLYCTIEKDQDKGEVTIDISDEYPKIIWEKDLPDKPTSINLGKKLVLEPAKYEENKRISYGAVINYKNPNLTTYFEDVTKPLSFYTNDKEAHDKQVQGKRDDFASQLKTSSVQIKENN